MESSLAYRSRIDKARGMKSTISRKLEEAEQKKALLLKRQIAVEFAQAIIQQVARETQESVRVHLEDIVQKCLDTVFPDEYTFKMDFAISRGKTEIKLQFFVDGEETDPMEAEGGGLVDIAALGLRIASWTLSGTRNTMIFDENMKFLSKDLQPRGAEVIKELSKGLGLQFIFASHSPDILAVADRIIDVKITRESINGKEYRVSKVTYS